ncbi:sugar phosphate isomerase/epimerase family protein [Cryptosporangium sp. NPDC051539]|uniref:sugar phosphate isomerase/epimerase family protein n=1 Tax=Cryptosporangium sp. NPDC051539 TaxID=3363962 RepID=UPI0037A222F0
MNAPTPTFGLPFPIAYASVSLHDLSPEQAVREAAAAGYAGVEWKVGDAPHAADSTASGPFLSANRCTIPPGPGGAALVRRLAAESGLAVVGLGPYLQVGDRDGLDAMFDMAVAAGSPQIRFQAPRLGREPFAYAGLAEATRSYVRAAGSHAARTGVRFVLELHHRTIAPSSRFA